MSAAVGFALAATLHAGFQVTVTLLVYPVLLRTDDGRWTAAHARHSRTIAPLVAVIYLMVLVTGALLLLAGPSPLGWVALAGTGAALATTAGLAAPLHGRLTSYDATLARTLLVVDRLRCVAALAGAVAAVVALAR